MNYLALILMTLNIASCKLIDVQFTNINQTVLLFEKSDPSIDFKIIRYLPIQCEASLKLVDSLNHVYLHYYQHVNCSSCIIDLNHNITLNVIFRQEITTIIDLPEINQIKLNVEYIFKYFNDSNYGLIKTDMTSNGIVSIIRIIYPKNDTIELKLTSFNKYFQIKRFLTNFYMIRLSENFRNLFKEYDTVELDVEAITSEITIFKSSLKFKILNVDFLNIKFNSEILEFNVSINQVKNYGTYLTKLSPQLTNGLFINNSTVDWRAIYINNFIRLNIESSDFGIFALDPIDGHLSILPEVNSREKLKYSNSKLVLNIAALDTKKIFKSSSIQVIVNLIDAKQTELINLKSEYEFELNEIKLFKYSSILFNKTNYFLVFNNMSLGLDQNNLFGLEYNLVNVKLNQNFINFNLFYIEKNSGKLWISEEIFKINRSEYVRVYNVQIAIKEMSTARLKLIDINLKIVLKSHDVLVSLKSGFSISNNFYFEVDLECLSQIGLLNIGMVPLRLTNESMNVKLDNFYERFFNLTLQIDGSLSLILNENYLNNKQAIKSLNYLEATIDYVNLEFESKSIKIFIKFLNKKFYKFDKEMFEFSLDENLNNTFIGFLMTNCPNLIEYQFISTDYSNDLNQKFKLIKNGKLIELWNTNAFDRETNRQFEFVLISKCKRDESEFLISTRVKVNVNDRNDNGFKFVNPCQNEFVFYKNLSSQDIAEGVDFLITRIEAFDLDDTESKLKYSLNKTSLIISPKCQDIFNLRLNLNQITGELSVSNLYSESSYKHCVFDYDVTITAFNSNNSENIRFYIKIDLLGQNLIFQKSIIYSDATYKIDFEDELLEYFELNECWINNFDSKYLLNTFLEHSVFYFYPKIDKNQTIQYKKIECKLSSSVIDSQSLNSWLIVNFMDEEDYILNETVLNFHLIRNQLLTENSFLLNLKNSSLPESEYILKVYRLSDSSEKIWNKIFLVNSLSGDLRTGTCYDQFYHIIQNVNLINLKIEIQVFDMSFSNKFLYNQELSVNLNIYETKLNDMEKIVQNFQGKFINVTISHLNETSDLKIICFGQKKIQENEIEITTSSINEIVFDDLVLEKTETNLNLFKIIESNNEQFLIYNSIYVSQNGVYQKFKLYLIHFKICYKIPHEHDSFTRDCLDFGLNVNIELKFNLNELVFSSDALYKNFIIIENKIFDQDLEEIDFNEPVIDLKQLVLGSNLIDWNEKNKLKFKPKSSHFISSSNRSSNFILDEKNGLIYMTHYSGLDSSFGSRISLENSNNYLSSLNLNFQLLKIDTTLIKNLTLRLSNEDFWLPFLDLDLTKINLAVYNRLHSHIKCQNLDHNECKKLIKFDQFTGFLALNQSEIYSLRVSNLKLLVYFSTEIRKLIKFKIEVNLKYEINEIKPLIESNVIHFVDTTEANQRILISNKSKFDNDSYLEVSRVKNLNTNTLVLALDYKIKTDKFENIYLEFPNVFSIEQNQIYSFDFVARYRENSSVSDRYMKQSIYVIRMSPSNFYSGQKSYFNTAGLNKFRINLTELNEIKNSNSAFLQWVFILDQINYNMLPHTKIENDFLDLDLTQINVMSEIKLKIYKFLIDKLSLEIVKAIEYEILIENFDWNVKKPTVYDLVEEFYFEIKLLKSELLLKLDKNRLDILIHEFKNEENLIEYSIDYTENVPFEIDSYSGKLFYIPSEDLKDFDSKFEKIYSFRIISTDLNGKQVDIHVDFSLIDDDPILYLGDELEQQFLIDKVLDRNDLIGKIDLKNSIIENTSNNFSKILQSLNSKFWKLEYELLKFDSNVDLNTMTGLLFPKNQIRNDDGKILNLRVQINGNLGPKKMIVLIDVYIIFEYATLTKQNLKLEFERKIFKFDENNSQVKTIKSNKELQRFRIIHRSEENCQIDAFTGNVNCVMDEEFKKIYLTTVVYNVENLDNFDFAKVEICLFNKKSSPQPNLNQDVTSLKYDLNYLPKVGDIVINVYDLIKIEIDYEAYRLYLIGNDLESSSISAYFELNIQSGDLILKNEILTNKLTLKQYIKLVYVDTKDLMNPIKTIQMFKLVIEFESRKKFNCFTKIDYNKIMEYESDFLDIGNITSRNSHLKYFLESYELKKSISNDFNLIINESVTFTETKNSLILINKSNRNIQINKTKFFELKLSSVEFFVSGFKTDDYMNNFDSLYSRQKCVFQVDFKNNFTDILSYIGLKRLDLDLTVQNKLIGELIFSSKEIILKNSKEKINSNFELISDQKIPFKLNPLNGDLYLSDFPNSELFKFSIRIDSSFLFNLRVRVISNYRLNIFKQDVCFKNSSSIKVKNNLSEEPKFEKEVYELNLSLDDFARSRPVLIFGVRNSNLNKLRFEYLNHKDGLSNLFSSILKLNELDGSIELNEYIKYLDFCQNLVPSKVNILLNVQAFNVDNPELYGRSIIKIVPNCDLNFINSKFVDSFYFVKISNFTRVGQYLTNVRLNQKTYDVAYSVCSNDSIVSIDKKTGQVYLNKKIDNTNYRYQIEICAYVTNKMIAKPIKIETKLIILVQEFKNNNAELKVFGKVLGLKKININLGTDKETNENLKLFQIESQNSLRISSTSSGLFSIDSDNWININKRLFNREKNYAFRIQGSTNIDVNLSFENKELKFFVNQFCKLGSKLLDLRSKYSDIYQFLLLESKQEDLLSLSDGFIYLSRIPLKMESIYEFYLKFSSPDSDFYLIKLVVTFVDFQIEDYQYRPRFDNILKFSNYYFSYRRKFYDSQFSIIGKIETGLIIKTERCLNDERYVDGLFKILNNQILIDNNQIINLDCSLYEIKLSNEILVYVKIENFKQIKYSNLTSNFKQSYTTIIKTDNLQQLFYSVNLFNLVNYVHDPENDFDKNVFLSTNCNILKEFHFNSDNGVLALNLNQTIANGTFLLKFELIFSIKYTFIKKIDIQIFILNGFVSGNEYFFANNYNHVTKIDGGLNFMDYLINPIDNSNIETLKNSSIELKMENFEPFDFDPLTGLLTHSIKQRFERLLNLSACHKYTNTCQNILIAFKFDPINQHSFDEIKNFFKNFKSTVTLDPSFNTVSPYLIKLRNFGSEFSYFKASSDIVKIDTRNGLVKLNTKNKSLLKNDQFYFLIFYNNSVFSEFFVKFKTKMFEFEQKKEVSIEIYGHGSEKVKKNFIGSLLNYPSVKCELWSEINVIKIDQECGLYFINNGTLNSHLNFQVRVYDSKYRIRSNFYDIKLNYKSFKVDGQKFIVEFSLITNTDEEIIGRFYEFLNSKYDFNILDYKDFGNGKTFLVSSMDKFDSLKQYTKLLEKNYSIKLLDVYTQNSAYEIIKTNQENLKNIIKSKNLIVNVPDTYEIFLDEESKFKNSIFFTKFSYFRNGYMNFENEQTLSLKFSFKIEGESDNQFLFSSILESGKYLNSELIDGSVEIFHNLGDQEYRILLENKIELFEWYEIEILIDEYFFVSLKKWDHVQKIFQEIDLYKKINSYFEYEINSIYLGGIPINETKFSTFKTYFSDQLSLSSFKINNKEILTNKLIEETKEINEQNVFKIKNNYKRYLEIEKFLFENRTSELSALAKGFNMTINYLLLNVSTFKSEIILLKTKNTEIILNLMTERVYFYAYNDFIISINSSKNNFENRLEIFVRPGLVKVSLNKAIREISVSKSLNSHIFELFYNDIYVSNSKEIIYDKIFVNSYDILKYYDNREFSADQDMNTIFLIKHSKIIKNATDIHFVESDSAFKPGLLLITISSSMLIGLLAVISILISIIFRKSKNKKKDSKNKLVDSKFNSRNPLEISVNSSSHSPISNSSSVSDFTNSQSLGRQTIQSIMNNSNNFSRVDLENISRLQNYFEYESSLTNRDMNSKSINSGNFLESILNGRTTRSCQAESSTILNANDLDQIKSFLSWTPDIFQYSNVLNEFEKFANNNHVCSNLNKINNNKDKNASITNTSNSHCEPNEINILGSLNLYEEYDRQTFV